MHIWNARGALAIMMLATPITLKAQAITLPRGLYVFLIQGASSDLPFGAANQAALIGSFVADGNGNITEGVADFNSSQATELDVPITGTYRTQNEVEILIELTSRFGTETLLIPPPPDHYPGVPITTWYMTALAPSAVHGSGALTGQGTTAFVPGHVLGSYTSLLSGESACDTACLLSGSHARVVTGTGALTISSLTNSFSTYFRESIGTSIQTSSSSGPISPLNPLFFPNGRMALQSASDQHTAAPSSFVAYIVDNTHLIFMSTDPHSRADLVSGTAFEPGVGLSAAVVKSDPREQ